MAPRRKTESCQSNLLDDGQNISGHRACRPREQIETRDSVRHAIIPMVPLGKMFKAMWAGQRAKELSKDEISTE